MTKGKQKDLLTDNIQAMTVQFGINKHYNNDWGTIAFSIPRNRISMNLASIEELSYNGIYFLIGFDGITEKIYTGQAKKRNNKTSILKRLCEHKNSTTEWYRDIWQSVVVVTGINDTWREDEISAVERIMKEIIPEENNLNGNTPRGDLDINCDAKIEQIKGYLRALCINTFTDKTETQVENERQMIIEYNTPVEDLQNGMARIPEIVTPYRVVKEMIDMLPEEIWCDSGDTRLENKKFIDLACKGGEYLREIYDRLMKNPIMKKRFENPIARSNHILTNQIYGIAQTPISLERATNNLLGFGYNLRVIPNYINILRGRVSATDGKALTLQNILSREFNAMKFDVVIGNPPYQETTGGGNNGGKAIYDSFILNGLNVSDKLCMIVKNNWMNSDSLKNLRETIFKSGLKTLKNYSQLGDIFPSMGIAASIIYIDKNYNGDIDYTEIVKDKIVNAYTGDIRDSGFIPASKMEYEIAQKVSSKAKVSFEKHVIGMGPFGINTNGKLTCGPDKDEYINDNLVKTDEYNIKLYYDKDVNYVCKEDIPKNTELIPLYKVICPKQIHKNNNPIPRILGLNPNEICTASFSLMYCGSSFESAVNVIKYIKTKLFRFLTFCLADSLCGLSAYRVSLVPDQDFTSNSDIDWSQSIADIDQQLYKKYNLTEEEIAYIEQTIKPMA